VLGSAKESLAQRPRGLVFFLSISAVQWLCNADKKSHSPPKRLYRFFSTLYTALVSVTLPQSGLCLLLPPCGCILARCFKSGILSKRCSEAEDWQQHPFPISLAVCVLRRAPPSAAVTPCLAVLRRAGPAAPAALLGALSRGSGRRAPVSGLGGG